MTRTLKALFVLLLLATPPLAQAQGHNHTDKPLVEVKDLGSRPDPAAKVTKVGGPFTLINQDGQTVTEKDFAGFYQLIFFGFTYCPDICPTELQTALEAVQELPPEQAKKFKILFISIDPKRDTPAVLKAYLNQIGPGLTGLTGSPDQIAAVAKAYKVYYGKSAETAHEEQDYLMDHSSFLYFMGPDGAFLKAFSAGTDTETLLKALRTHLKP